MFEDLVGRIDLSSTTNLVWWLDAGPHFRSHQMLCHVGLTRGGHVLSQPYTLLAQARGEQHRKLVKLLTLTARQIWGMGNILGPSPSN